MLSLTVPSLTIICLKNMIKSKILLTIFFTTIKETWMMSFLVNVVTSEGSLNYYGCRIVSVTGLSSDRDITLKSVFYKISGIFLEFFFHKKWTEINAYIIAKNHRNYAHFINVLSKKSVKCLRDMTKCYFIIHNYFMLKNIKMQWLFYSL